MKHLEMQIKAKVIFIYLFYFIFLEGKKILGEKKKKKN